MAPTAADEATQPLLPAAASSSPSTQPDDSPSSAVAMKRNALFSPTAIAVQALSLVFVGLIWALVFDRLPSPLPLFGYHPLLQSLSLLLLAQGVLVLQPTSQSRPNEKKAAFQIHQLVALLLILPVVTAGSAIMFYLHHPASHWISWHGILGSALTVWLWAQAALGAATVWGGGKLLGGEAKAKSWWKWHRLSGYILLPAFLL